MPTPSPNQIAAMWILNQLDEDVYEDTLDDESFAELSDSRVNEVKAEKVRLQISKITKKMVERCQKIINRLEEKKLNIKVSKNSKKSKESVKALSTRKKNRRREEEE